MNHSEMPLGILFYRPRRMRLKSEENLQDLIEERREQLTDAFVVVDDEEGVAHSFRVTGACKLPAPPTPRGSMRPR